MVKQPGKKTSELSESELQDQLKTCQDNLVAHHFRGVQNPSDISKFYLLSDLLALTHSALHGRFGRRNKNR